MRQQQAYTFISHDCFVFSFFFFLNGMGPCSRVFACTISLQWCLRNSTLSTLVGYPVHVLTSCLSVVLGWPQEISEDNSVITISQCDQLLLLTSIPTLPRFKSLLGLKIRGRDGLGINSFFNLKDL